MGANHGENTITIAAQRPHIENGFHFFSFPLIFYLFFFISVLQLFFFLLKSVFFYIILQMRNCAAYFVNTYTVCMGHIHKHTYTRTYFMHCRVHRPRILFLFRMHAYFVCMLIFFFIYFFLFSNSRRNHGFAAIGSFLCSTEQWCWFFLFFRFFFYLNFFLFGFSVAFFSIIRYAFYTVFSEFSTSNTLPEPYGNDENSIRCKIGTSYFLNAKICWLRREAMWHARIFKWNITMKNLVKNLISITFSLTINFLYEISAYK